MKRKINLVGNNTLTVSLPSKWAKKYHLKKGDELDLDENGPELKINQQKIRINKEITIKLDGNATSSLIWRYLKSAYIKGFDTIIVEYTKEKIPNNSKGRVSRHVKNEEINTSDLLNTIAGRLFGLIVIEQIENKFVLKDLGISSDVDLTLITKKIFLHVKTLAEKTKEVLISREEEKFRNILSLENNINNLVDYVMRVINKKTFPSDYEREICLVSITLERIGDTLFRIFENAINHNIKLTKDEEKLFDKLIDTYTKFYQNYWFNKKEIPNIYKQCKLFKKEVDNSLSVKNKKEIPNIDKECSCLNKEMDNLSPGVLKFEFRAICSDIQSMIEIMLYSLCESKIVEE